MNKIDKNMEKLLDNYSENRKSISESKKNIYSKITYVLLSLLIIGLSSFFLLEFGLPVFVISSILVLVVPQIITLKYQGSYKKNIRNIINSKKEMKKGLNEYKKTKDLEIIKKQEEIKSEEQIKHDLSQKELEIAFSDENYYPYIERIKSKILKR